MISRPSLFLSCVSCVSWSISSYPLRQSVQPRKTRNTRKTKRESEGDAFVLDFWVVAEVDKQAQAVAFILPDDLSAIFVPFVCSGQFQPRKTQNTRKTKRESEDDAFVLDFG